MRSAKYISIYLSIIFFTGANAQQNFDVNSTDIAAGPGLLYAINGQQFSSERFSNLVDGSPFFNTEFMKSVLLTEGGKRYGNFSVRLNLLDGTVNYLNDKNQEMEATVPIREVYLTDVLTNQNFRFIHAKYVCSGEGKSWYRVIDSGAVSLYRNEIRVMTENKPYGSATTQQTILKDPSYYLVNGSECFKIKSVSELARQLTLINPSFAEKISKQKIKKGRVEKDLQELIQQFNGGPQ